MPKARQQYNADEETLRKQRREFSIDSDIAAKIDSVETGAQVNVIETVKVNGTALVPDVDKAVDVSVPLVEYDLYGTDRDAALSAEQGKILYDYIQNIQSRGRYLSNWNCVTGLAVTNPGDNPYDYRSGDYYIVSNVASSGGTNLRPDGAQYIINQASLVTETQTVKVGDSYIYDGTNWILLVNTEREIPVDPSLDINSHNAVENQAVVRGLNTKQDILTEGDNIQIRTISDVLTISATDTTYPNLPAAQGGVDDSLVTTGEKYTWNNKQDELHQGQNIQIGMVSGQLTISATDTTYSSLPASQGGTDVSLVTTGDKYNWNNKAETSIIDNTAYGSGWNSDITHAPTKDAVYDKINAMDTTIAGKQDTLIAGNNITIASDGKTISSDETVYCTQAQYTALLPGAASDGKNYIIYEDTGGGGWQPGANTIARWKLDGDTTDSTNNGYDLTAKTGSISYGTLSGGSKYGIFDGNTVLTVTQVPSWTKGTLSFWSNKSATGEMVSFAQSTNTNGSDNYVQEILDTSRIAFFSPALAANDFSYTQSINQWYHIVLTQDGTDMKLYVNNILIDTWNDSSWFNAKNGDQLCVGGLNRGSQFYSKCNGYISNMIIESEAWSSSDVDSYYNSTKNLYGIS